MIKTSISRYGKRTLHNTSLHSCILEAKLGHFGHTKEPCKQSQSQEQHRKAPNPQQQNSKPRTPSSQPKIKPYTNYTGPAPNTPTHHSSKVHRLRSEPCPSYNKSAWKNTAACRQRCLGSRFSDSKAWCSAFRVYLRCRGCQAISRFSHPIA